MATKKQSKKRTSRHAAAAPEGAEGPTAEGTETPDRAPEAKAEKPSDFIRRQLSAGKSAGEILEAAKAAGLEFSRALIYAIKSKGPSAGPRRGPGRPPGARAKAVTRARRAAPVGGAGPDEAQFRRLAIELGIERARTLLDDLEQAIARIIG